MLEDVCELDWKCIVWCKFWEDICWVVCILEKVGIVCVEYYGNVYF